MRLEHRVRDTLQWFRAYRERVRFPSQGVGQQQRILKLGRNMVGFPKTEKVDCKGWGLRFGGWVFQWSWVGLAEINDADRRGCLLRFLVLNAVRRKPR